MHYEDTGAMMSASGAVHLNTANPSSSHSITSTPFPDLIDTGMDGLFYVNDPSNNLGNEFPYIGDRKNGFNDLQRRKADMCMLLNADCSGSIRKHPVAKMIGLIRFIPLPEGGH